MNKRAFSQHMTNQNLFPYRRIWMCLKLSSLALFLLLVGGAAIWYHVGASDVPAEVYREKAFFVIFVIVFFYAGITTVLFKGNVIRFRCPHCGKRSVRMEYDPPTVMESSKWQTQNMIAKCQSCGFQQQTGIQKTSNMFIKYFNVKDK